MQLFIKRCFIKSYQHIICSQPSYFLFLLCTCSQSRNHQTLNPYGLKMLQLFICRSFEKIKLNNAALISNMEVMERLTITVSRTLNNELKLFVIFYVCTIRLPELRRIRCRASRFTWN